VFDGGRVAAGTVWCVFLQDCSTAGWSFRTDVDSFENGAFAIVAPQNHLIVRAVTQALLSEDEVSAIVGTFGEAGDTIIAIWRHNVFCLGQTIHRE
jgi:hypothetical protein